VAEAGLTPVETVAVKIDPGVSVVVVLKESSLVLDTWPEAAYATVDLHTCGDYERGKRAFQRLCAWFCPEQKRIHERERGPHL